MPPPQPESPLSADDPSGSAAQPRSRAELQKQRRTQTKKERRYQHRWRRRTISTLVVLVVLGALGTGGLYAYTNYRFDQIKKIHSKHLVDTAAVRQQKPYNILIVGSDSRSFVSNSTQVRAFGNESNAGGQRSDVTMVARLDPVKKTVTILSIPRDLWVDIPGNGPVSGMNRINAAYDTGPDLLIQTIERDLGIPINHYIAVNFPGFQSMVDALGGVTMDFPTQVKDEFTGLHVSTTGCQTVNGTVALQLVRSRHLYYMNSNGYWTYDGASDFSRIQRQDAFFRAVLAKAGGLGLTDPITVNNFVSAAVTNLTIDDTLSKGDLLNIANDFKGLPKKHLVTQTLPTIGYTTGGGAAVLKLAQPFAQNLIGAFNAIGTPQVTPAASTTTTTTTTTGRAVSPGDVDVDVLNASSVAGMAHTTATALSAQGFHVAQIGNAPTLAAGSPSEIRYGQSGYAAALSLGSGLGGPVRYVTDSSLKGNLVALLVAGTSLSVHAPVTGTTTTTLPASTTGTTIPSDVVTNNQPEPWNPYPCTPGPASQAAPSGPRTPTTGSKK